MIEVVTAIVIIAVIAAVVVSNDNPETANDRARYDAAADALYNLAQAIAGYEPTKTPRSFHQLVGVYPGKLSDLTTAITAAGKNICGNAYTGPGAGSNINKWQAAVNPFYPSQLLTTGTPIAPGFTLQDALVLLVTPAANPGSSSENTMYMRMTNVTLADAQGLDLAVDGIVNGSAGIIRYAATDPTNVDYYISISVTNSTSIPNC